jgi:hypothetical protein
MTINIFCHSSPQTESPDCIDNAWIEWRSGAKLTDELYVELLKNGYSYKDIFFPNDRENRLFNEEDPKKLGRNLIRLALEHVAIDKVANLKNKA